MFVSELSGCMFGGIVFFEGEGPGGIESTVRSLAQEFCELKTAQPNTPNFMAY